MTQAVNYNTADRIIRLAMRDAQILEKGEDPDGEDYVEAMHRLNDIINLWQTQGLKLWLNSWIPVPIQANQPTYVLGPGGFQPTKSMRILEGWYTYNSGGASYPFRLMSWREYDMLSNKLQTGMPISMLVDKQQLVTNITLWLVPDANAVAIGGVTILQQTPVTNLVKLTDAMNFPQEWFMALHWALADDMANGQPREITERCAAKAKTYFDLLNEWDVEDAATSFSPDPTSGR
jgi:hypothetical protein